MLRKEVATRRCSGSGFVAETPEGICGRAEGVIVLDFHPGTPQGFYNWPTKVGGVDRNARAMASGEDLPEGILDAPDKVLRLHGLCRYLRGKALSPQAPVSSH